MAQTTYTVITQTANARAEGSTDATVSIQLLNEEGDATGWHMLDNFWYNDFEKGQIDTFSITTKDVGLPKIIRIKLDRDADSSGWNCKKVTVSSQVGEAVFHVNDWVLDEIVVASGKAELPQNETLKIVRDIRKQEVAKNHVTYRWNVVGTADLPFYCHADKYEDLPPLFRYNDIQYENLQDNKDVALINALLFSAKDAFVDTVVKEYDDYLQYILHPDLPKDKTPFHDRWFKDEEFGRQMLNGVNATAVSLCTKVPPQFLKAEKEIFRNGETFKEEIKAKRIFIIDHRDHSTGVKRNKTKQGDILFCADSVTLFQVQLDKRFLPIAILLEEGGDVFTPYDNEHDWMLAKHHFRCNDTCVHEWVYHLFRTHLVMEPVAVGMFRSLSRRHPIYKLLRPHLQTIPAINTIGRVNLIGPGSSADMTLALSEILLAVNGFKLIILDGLDLGKRAFRLFDYDELNIPNYLKAKGTDDEKTLPLYHYREDAHMLWSAIEKYVKAVVHQYYAMDEDVVKDFELKEFIRTVAIDGVEAAGQGLKGFPTQLKTIPELVNYLTVTIFTSSVQHAASNFGQYEIYKFIPNAPAGMRLPPHKKGEGSFQQILETLPDTTMTLLQLGTANTLSSYSPTEVFLGKFPLQLFMEGEIDEHQAAFRSDLDDITRAINARNENLQIPYTYLLPETIPNSIGI